MTKPTFDEFRAVVGDLAKAIIVLVVEIVLFGFVAYSVAKGFFFTASVLGFLSVVAAVIVGWFGAAMLAAIYSVFVKPHLDSFILGVYKGIYEPAPKAVDPPPPHPVDIYTDEKENNHA